jgi:hypothetical protein
MTVSVNGTTGITFNDASTQNTAATGFGFKNRIINGAMVVSQYNGTSSVTANNGVFGVDRFKISATQSSKGTMQQNAGSVTPPAGFTNYLGLTSSSAFTPASGDLIALLHRVEGFNSADLAWGTANAQPVTLSFWVRSSLTGTFGGGLGNADGSYTYPFSYTISTANTWQQITLTITGATSGTWDSTSGTGINISWSLATGSTFSGTAGSWTGAVNAYNATGATQPFSTNGATFYITGVQLEKGSTATSFDYRPYGTELQLCQRYFYKFGNTAGAEIMPITAGCWGSSGRCSIYLGVPMRAAPTVSLSGTAAGSFFITNGNDSAYINLTYTSGGSAQSGVNTSPYINYTSDVAAGIGSLYIQSNRVLSVNAEL